MIIPKELITIGLFVFIVITCSFLVIELCNLLYKLISKYNKLKEDKEDKLINDETYKIKALIETTQTKPE